MIADAEARHMKLTTIRAAAYQDLFDDKPVAADPANHLRTGDDDAFLIDVFVYSFEIEGEDGPVLATVTNGMSDQRMAEGDDPEQPRRRELIPVLQ